MSESTSPRVTFNKKLKFEVGKPKSSKRSENNDGGSERGTFKRGPRSSSREEDDGKRGYGEESSNLKRKRVYGERGVEKGAESKNGGVHNKTGYERRKSRVKDDVSDIDRLNRAKFSSSRGKNTRKDEFSEARCRKREVGSSRGYKEKERRGGEESFDGKFKAKVKTRERLVSSRRGENVDDEFDSKFKSQTKTRERWPSSKRDGKSDSKFESQGKTRERWPSTKRDGESDRKLTTKDKARDRLSFTKHDNAEDGSHKQDTRDRTDSDRQVDSKSNNRREVGVVDNSKKKMLRSKKSEEENILEDGPRKKKKKKRLGIHPYDISSKKVDDGISIDGTTAEKKVDPNKDVEISQNAQFRAIQPSPSILSFVEDNLLGRRRSIDLRRAGYNIDFSSPLDNVPLSTSTERERIEEAVFRNKLEFFAAAKVSSSFPAAELPEIAFAGRSNVGKSSLLNSLTRQWGVVRTSDKPGLTQTINFFKLGKKLCMVDLPGYGFAYAKEEVKDAWEELVKEYVSTRVGLKRVCLLIDTKWGMKPRDQELINLMERSQTKYQIVLTKSDTVFPMDVARRAMQIEEALKANKSVVQPVMMVSSKSGGGIRSLRTVLAKVARFVKV